MYLIFAIAFQWSLPFCLHLVVDLSNGSFGLGLGRENQLALLHVLRVETGLGWVNSGRVRVGSIRVYAISTSFEYKPFSSHDNVPGWFVLGQFGFG